MGRSTAVLLYGNDLLLSETQRLLHRDRHLVLQCVVRLVRRQIQPVETNHVRPVILKRGRDKNLPGVRFGERRRIPRLFDREPSRPVRPLQILEPVDRDSRGTRRELQQPRLLLRIPGAHDLPEVLDHLVLLLVPAVVRVLLPVVHVDVRDTSDQQLEFPLVKHIDQIRGDQLVEARHERIELLLHPLDNLPLSHQPVSVSLNPPGRG